MYYGGLKDAFLLGLRREETFNIYQLENCSVIALVLTDVDEIQPFVDDNWSSYKHMTSIKKTPEYIIQWEWVKLFQIADINNKDDRLQIISNSYKSLFIGSIVKMDERYFWWGIQDCVQVYPPVKFIRDS